MTFRARSVATLVPAPTVATASAATFTTMGLRAAFRIPGPDERVDGWHISPLVDLSAYSLSWLWVLAPLLLMGETRKEYLPVYLLIIAATDLHRHFGLPYVYADAQVRERYPARFWLFPAVLLLAWMVSPWLDHSQLVFDTASTCALVALVIVLLQIIRRDGGPDAPPSRALALVLVATMGPAAILHTIKVQLAIGLQPAWWWFAAALSASTWLDWQRLRQRGERAPESTESTGEQAITASGEQAIAVSGGKGFVASLSIVALLGFALLAGPWLEASQAGGGVKVGSILAAVGVFAALWNFWHVYMQKYGILRMYNAKAKQRPGTPGWNDKALLLCWLPLYFAWLGPVYREIAVDYFDDASAVLPGFIDLLSRAMPVTVPLTAAFVVVVYVLWLRAEWRANKLRSAPRLWMVAGTTGLALCFFVFDPIKVYMAFAFSHALEYCVFVWAFQRRRYHAKLEHDPALGKLLRRPVLFYLAMVLAFGVAILLAKYWGRYIFEDAERPTVLGYRTSYWLGFWGIYQSMAHFYFDGFLWKMRLPSVRANL